MGATTGTGLTGKLDQVIGSITNQWRDIVHQRGHDQLTSLPITHLITALWVQVLNQHHIFPCMHTVMGTTVGSSSDVPQASVLEYLQPPRLDDFAQPRCEWFTSKHSTLVGCEGLPGVDHPLLLHRFEAEDQRCRQEVENLRVEALGGFDDAHQLVGMVLEDQHAKPRVIPAIHMMPFTKSEEYICKIVTWAHADMPQVSLKPSHCLVTLPTRYRGRITGGA